MGRNGTHTARKFKALLTYMALIFDAILLAHCVLVVISFPSPMRQAVLVQQQL